MARVTQTTNPQEMAKKIEDMVSAHDTLSQIATLLGCAPGEVMARVTALRDVAQLAADIFGLATAGEMQERYGVIAFGAAIELLTQRAHNVLTPPRRTRG